MRPHALLFGAADYPEWRDRAALGGPYGEVLMMDSLAFGLDTLGVATTRCARLREFAVERLRRRRPLVFIDPVRLSELRRFRLLGAAARRRCGILEWYGTPPEIAALAGTAPAQYLVPYDRMNGWNRFLGYVVHLGLEPRFADASAIRRRLRANLGRKRRQGIVWGKELRYFVEHRGLIEALASECDIHVTVATGQVSGELRLPKNVINHGHLSRESWRALLAESSFLLGLGDPVSGPSALEALAEGCVYIDPRYATPRAINGLAQVTVTSQHPYASGVGAPWSRVVNLGDLGAVREAVLASFDTAAREAAVDPLVDALTPFTEAAYVDRLRGILDGMRARERA